MKKHIILFLCFLVVFSYAYAQEKNNNRMNVPRGLLTDSISPLAPLPQTGDETMLPPDSVPPLHNDSVPKDSTQIYSWKINPRLGERIMTPMDTAFLNFHQTTLMEGQDVSVGYLGNIGSPSQTNIFFNRNKASDFNMLEAYRYSYKRPQDHIFLNTKTPYSNIFYQTGGSGAKNEARFQAELSSNFGKKVNVGFDFDYVYARGLYTALYNKQINYDLFGSYLGDKYKMQFFVSNNSFTNSENGGIQNDLYITNPESSGLPSFGGQSLDIPVNINGGTFNRLRGRNIYITNRYDLGSNTIEKQINDSTIVRHKIPNYVAPASIIFTTHYTDQRRRIQSTEASSLTSTDSLSRSFKDMPYYFNGIANRDSTALYQGPQNDLHSYYSFKNTVALSMNEGFRKWVKFGLTAFVEYNIRKYSLPDDPSISSGVNTRKSRNELNIGGVLSKQNGKYLRYKISGEKDLLDGDFELKGDIETSLWMKDKEMSVKAQAYIRGIAPNFFEENFMSKYRGWQKDFNDIKRVYVGGEINIPFTNSRISGGVENIQNYIYYDSIGVSAQKSGSIQIITLRLDQKLQAGIFHWDNQIVFQKSSDDELLPLPTLSLYTNMYLYTKIARVLSVQLGVDAHYNTEYYAPVYDPLTMQFHVQSPNQERVKIGNFPVMTAYLNLHLKYTRFFIMLYNVADGMGNAKSFTTPHYPINPRFIKMGLSWQFNN